MIDVVDARSVPARVLAVALVLHGGRMASCSVTPNQLAVRRMRPFARSLEAAGGAAGSQCGRGSTGSGLERHRPPPVADATWALEQVTERYGDVPVVLVGHSMGGRTAVHVAGHSRVVGIAALAPGSHIERSCRLRVTESLGMGARHHDQPAALPRLGAKSRPSPTRWWVGIRRNATPCCGAALWHRMATEFTLAALGLGAPPEPPRWPATTGSTSISTTTNRRREVCRHDHPVNSSCTAPWAPTRRTVLVAPVPVRAWEGNQWQSKQDAEAAVLETARYRDRHRRDPDDRVRHVRRRLRRSSRVRLGAPTGRQALDERLGRTRPS